MSVSVPLSYKCAVNFLIKNVHFIQGSVNVASGHLLQLQEAAPLINYYDMLCSLCKRSSLVCVFFSNSLFLCKHFLEVHMLTTTYQKALILEP